ncbi:MAG TPA: AraC family transcriptional regulator [Burkholderiaceae bacterium]|nr:AraC family transcriptional regulator [Burkholderiaceae bacterium]
MTCSALFPLHPPGWSGLPVYTHVNRAPTRLESLHLDTPLLTLWSRGGAELYVHQSAGRHWHFCTRPHRFDIYAAGDFASITTGGAADEAIVVALPEEQALQLLDLTHADWASIEHSRFQFADRGLERLVRALADHAVRGQPLGPLYSRALSTALLTRLLEAHGPESDAAVLAPEASALMRRLIDSRLADPPSLQDLARVTNLRTARFLEAFRASFGLTPHQFVIERRVERAKSLLRTDASMMSVALEVGYASHAHFSASFRARTGSTPSEYRRAIRGVAAPCESADPTFA